MASNRETARSKIAAFVAKFPGSSAGEIAKGTGIGIVRVCAILKSETDAGRMVRAGVRLHYTYTSAPAEVSA